MLIHAHIEPEYEIEPRRAEPREAVCTEIGLRPFGTEGGPARLVNVSSRGFMARSNALIDPGTRIWLTLPGLPRVSAVVMWAKGGRLGGEFAAPIDVLAVIQASGKAAR